MSKTIFEAANFPEERDLIMLRGGLILYRVLGLVNAKEDGRPVTIRTLREEQFRPRLKVTVETFTYQAWHDLVTHGASCVKKSEEVRRQVDDDVDFVKDGAAP